jgi:glutathione S-transferase
MLAGCVRLPAWEQRVAELGEGERVRLDPGDAFAAAKSSEPAGTTGVDAGDPLGLAAGAPVSVRAVTSDRGASHGVLAGLSAAEIVIALDSEALGALHVHFPRLGYRVQAA